MQNFVKKYNIKIFGQDGTYKKTISPSLLMSDISFSEDINGGQGNLTVSINLNYGDISISPGDIVNIFVIDDLYKDGTSKYWGYVEYINRIIDEKGERIELSLLGYFSLLTEVLYESGGLKVFTKNTEPHDIIDDIIDNFNIKYPFPGIIKDTDLTGTTVNLSFDYTDSLSALRQVQEKTGFYFFIDENAILRFKPKPIYANHLVKLNHDLVSISSSQTILNTINKLYLERGSGAIIAYEDLTSQSSYGLREKRETQSDIQDLGTQDIFGNKYIQDNKDPKFQTEMTINYKYLAVGSNKWSDIYVWSDTISPWDGTGFWNDFGANINMENIRPGDTITVLNTEYKLTNLQIQKIDYNSEFIKVYLDKYTGIGDLLVLKK